MYERAPYPGLGANLKDPSSYLNPIKNDLEKRGVVRYLEVGCGTGHLVVAVAKRYPHWQCYGIDLSSASLDVARKLAEVYKVRVTLHQGSYLDPLPFEGGPFDVISAMGTIHHLADPIGAMKALRNVLKEDGYLWLHLYGWRCDREKFDIKEALTILERDLFNHRGRFQLYKALMEHRRRDILRRVARTSPMDLYIGFRHFLRDLNRRLRGISWSPPWHARYDAPSAPWIDHFCHPCERAYEVTDVEALVKQSGFRVVRMLGQGRENLTLLPRNWRHPYDGLDEWQKWRLMELLSPGGRSFAMIVQKA